MKYITHQIESAYRTKFQESKNLFPTILLPNWLPYQKQVPRIQESLPDYLTPKLTAAPMDHRTKTLKFHHRITISLNILPGGA